jgi:hypothetical protein
MGSLSGPAWCSCVLPSTGTRCPRTVSNFRNITNPSGMQPSIYFALTLNKHIADDLDQIFVSAQGENPKKPCRKPEEVVRFHKCGWNGCEKGYDKVDHLNLHVLKHSHRPKRNVRGNNSLASSIYYLLSLNWQICDLIKRVTDSLYCAT